MSTATKSLNTYEKNYYIRMRKKQRVTPLTLKKIKTKHMNFELLNQERYIKVL